MNKIVVKISVLIALVVFLIVSLSIIGSGRKKAYCNSILVSFKEDYQFVTEKRIIGIVYEKIPNIKRKKLKSLNTEELEIKIEKHPWVKNAEVFKSYGLNDSLKISGTLNIYIEQELPIMRVMFGADGYYVSADGDEMPLSSNYTPKVVVVTGHIEEKYLKKEVTEFIKYINEEPFWKSQIQQIHIRADNELVLVPRAGRHLILFGKAEKFDLKFRNLMAVYKDGFSKGNWNKYKYVSLKFDNQVICTLK